jgi:CheY-like chemotaxis protein
MTNLSKWHVLVVEDEPDGQDVVAQILELYKISTDAVETAEDALARLEQTEYTAAIIDLNLPAMDGIELVRQIRAHTVLSALPCIAITAYHTSAVKQQALASGFDAYFAKPLDDTAFARELERVVTQA